MNTNAIFIIPNSAAYIKDDAFNSPDEWDKDYLNRLQRRADKIGLRVNGKKVVFRTNEHIIQVWWTGSGSENWGDHGLPDELCGSTPSASDEECLERDFMVSFIPYRCIENLKEGEALEVEINKKKVLVRANQLDYRYKRFGRFESVLQRVIL